MRIALVLATALLLACSSTPRATDGGARDAGGPRADAGTDADAPPRHDDAAAPATLCSAPPLADVSSPTATVGDGTPGSCTAAALQTAATAGGVIVFDCGPAAITITVTKTITFTHDTVLDGGGLVTLSGGGRSRILYLDS